MKLKYEFVTMDMNGQIVAVPVGDTAGEVHGMLRMNKTAALILSLLKEDTTEEQIVDTLMERFDAEKDLLSSEVHKLILYLQNEELVC